MYRILLFKCCKKVDTIDAAKVIKKIKNKYRIFAFFSFENRLKLHQMIRSYKEYQLTLRAVSMMEAVLTRSPSLNIRDGLLVIYSRLL
jgi:glutamate mutase epsilon subunit